jgi:hypothetical protein
MPRSAVARWEASTAAARITSPTQWERACPRALDPGVETRSVEGEGDRVASLYLHRADPITLTLTLTLTAARHRPLPLPRARWCLDGKETNTLAVFLKN